MPEEKKTPELPRACRDYLLFVGHPIGRGSILRGYLIRDSTTPLDAAKIAYKMNNDPETREDKPWAAYKIKHNPERGLDMIELVIPEDTSQEEVIELEPENITAESDQKGRAKI